MPDSRTYKDLETENRTLSEEVNVLKRIIAVFVEHETDYDMMARMLRKEKIDWDYVLKIASEGK